MGRNANDLERVELVGNHRQYYGSAQPRADLANQVVDG
jgi:hypothetical protein